MIDLRMLTEDEIGQLLQRCIGLLSEETLFQTLTQSLTKDQKTELSDEWFNLYAKR